jgi:hypothetical protein
MLGVNNIVIEKKHCHWQIEIRLQIKRLILILASVTWSNGVNMAERNDNPFYVEQYEILSLDRLGISIYHSLFFFVFNSLK